MSNAQQKDFMRLESRPLEDLSRGELYDLVRHWKSIAERRQDFVESQLLARAQHDAFMQKWKATTSYYAGHTWHSSTGARTSFQAGPFETREEADAALVRNLKASGYEPPRWWQWWRWSESVPQAWRDADE